MAQCVVLKKRALGVFFCEECGKVIRTIVRAKGKSIFDGLKPVAELE